MKPLSKCKKGDIIQAPDGSKAKVLARLENLIFRSEWYRYDVASYCPMTIEEAEAARFKILTRDGKEPMKKKEVENLLNIKITD